MWAGLTKAITGPALNNSQARKWERSFVDEFRYLGYVMTADCRDDKDIGKQLRRKNEVGNMLVWSSHLHLWRQKSSCSSHIVTQFIDVHFGVIYTRTLSENLLSVRVTHSNDFLIAPIHQLESGICDERNWPYQCCVPQIWLQFDEQSNNFLPQYCYCNLSIVMQMISLHWWISGRVYYHVIIVIIIGRSNFQCVICHCVTNYFVIKQYR